MLGSQTGPMSPISAHHRFRDPRSTTYDFLESVLVRCPGCDKAAHVVAGPESAGADDDHGRKMTVVARLPAWMQQATATRCCGPSSASTPQCFAPDP